MQTQPQSQNQTQKPLEDKWKSATLSNNFIFYKVMRDHIPACQKLIEMLLNIKIEHIELHTEEVIEIDFDAKGADPETNLYTGVIDYTPSSTVTAAEASNSGSTIKPNGTSEVVVGYATVIGTTGYVEIAHRKYLLRNQKQLASNGKL